MPAFWPPPSLTTAQTATRPLPGCGVHVALPEQDG
jgi:hypothetical protein